MTTRDYAEAYDDDSDQVRGWAAQDAEEPPITDVLKDFAYKIAELSTEVGHLQFDLDEATAQRDEAWATIARMTLGVGP